MSGTDTVIPSLADYRLLDVAELLALGLKRARMQAAAGENRKNSTGLCAGIERVSVSESGQ
jgi:hypothetical protein